MSGNAGEAGSKAVDVDVEADAIYHVRLIHSWPPLSKSPPLDNDLVSSFYGLQLELRGKTKDPNDPQSPITLFNDGQSVSKTGEIRKATTALLHFGSYSAPSPAILAPLEAITGPFEVVVLGKMPTPTSMNEDVLAALQQMVPVQAENTLLEINGGHIVLDSSSSGADVYRRLWCVTSRASLAAPYELTFRRHNLAQASAKIVPFARRKDVQDAQIAQLGRLAAQEAALSIEVRRKQLFLVQQLDFEREHYLVAYVSGPLQQLHTDIMGGGQWQAFEYGKTLWYFHAPSARLYAQHPLRSHPEARKLIEKVQQQVQQAVRRLQRKTRSHQRRRRLMAVIQAEMQRREEEKRKEQQRHEDVVRRIQLRIRARQRRKRFLVMIEAAKRRQEELQREQEREQQRAEERRREEHRAEENQQIERLKQERQHLQQELTELKTELQQLRLLKETKLPVQTETQTSARRDENAIEMMRREEQQRLQQRLETLELDLQALKEIKPSNESETQTSSRSSENDGEQQRARRRVEELELQLRHRDTKEVAESVTQTSGRRGGSLREEGVDTGDDLEWQRYLTLLRVAVKKKKTSPKSRHTQTDQFDGEETLLASSMLRAPQHAVSFSPSSRKPSGEWKGFPSWQRGSSNSNSAYSSNSSSTTSLLTLKSSLGQFDELDAVSPPTRTFESFFAPDFNMSSDHPPPPLVEQPWRQDSTFLPLKSSRKMLEITPVHQPLHEYEDPIRPMKNSSSFMISPASSPTNATKLPYITRRRKKNAS
ncbi:hypothetical protein PR003_g15036 [Phytophthora rubi]|uniref:Uncharacterized protein n=1 Tax=Phytophthora rubi TaxID=129364 RepID=A0A6A3L673_9STRA|nr:hypothetical protein PR002_g14481 [Phytophthora rubi]KAE9018290.1 hypothetical protein PR001_g14183 [Phytophthora rubi]KAE9331393.1 hypothetical protein PR003_g15036 [Phytophthora rubi]